MPPPPAGWEDHRPARPKVDPAAAKLERRPPARRFTTAVVGCSFAPGYPGIVLVLEDDPAPLLHLVRDTGNRHDPNAVAVQLGPCGRHLGHLPRNVAAIVAPALDAGDRYQVAGHRVLVSWQNPDRPGLELELEAVAAPAGGQVSDTS